MSDSVEVRVSADIADLKAQLAEAQASVAQFAARVADLEAAGKKYGPGFVGAALAKDTAALKEAQATAAGLAAEIANIETPAKEATVAVGDIAPAMDRVGTAADHARVANSGMLREGIVLSHELLTGNFERIPGSLMVMAERTGGLRAALAAITPEIAAIGLAVIGVTALFAEWAIQAYKVEQAVKAASIAAVAAGRSGPGARQEIQQGGQQIQAQGTLSGSQSEILAASINQLGELTDEQKTKVNDLASAFAALFQGNIAETEKFISKTFESDAALKSYLDRVHALGPDGQRAWDMTTNAAQRLDIGIQALTARLGPAFEAYKRQVDEQTIEMNNASIIAAQGGMAAIPQTQYQQPPDSTRGNIPQQSSALIDNTAASMGVSTAIANFATRIAEVESRGQQVGGPGSIKGPNEITTSSAGALGMMQVEPDSQFTPGGSATQRTVDGQAYDLTDPIQNVKAGLAILADLFRQFGGDQYKVAVGYNAGPRVATGQVQQSAANAQQTAGYTQQLGLSPSGQPAAFQPFGPSIGATEPGTTGDPAAERAQKITDANDYMVKISQIDAEIKGQNDALATDEAQLAAASQMADGQAKDSAVAAAQAKVDAVQRSIQALNAEKAAVRSPADEGAAKTAQAQISAAKLSNDQKDSDPKQRAIDDANAEVTAYQQAAATFGISEAAKQQFIERTQQAEAASINAVRAAEGDWAAQRQAQILQIEAEESQAGGDRQQIELRTTAAIKTYWQSVVADTTLTTDQRRQAENKLAEATKEYALESATAAKDAQHKQLRATETRISAETAAERGNVSAIIALEQEKVDAVRAVHGLKAPSISVRWSNRPTPCGPPSRNRFALRNRLAKNASRPRRRHSKRRPTRTRSVSSRRRSNSKRSSPTRRTLKISPSPI